MKFTRYIISTFQAISTLVGFSIIGFLFYTELSPPFNLLALIALLILGLYTSWFVFKMMSRRGVITTMTGDNASYELDNLEPMQGDGVSKINSENISKHFLDKRLNIGKCKISIWGDWEGRMLNISHVITGIDFCVEQNVLTISFDSKCLLKVRNPKMILFSDSYLKIIKAEEVLWETPLNYEKYNQYIYTNTGKEILTKSNTKWIPHSLDLGIGMNAVYLQG